MIDYIVKRWKWFLFGGVILLCFFIGLLLGNVDQIDSFMRKPITELEVAEFIVVAIFISLFLD